MKGAPNREKLARRRSDFRALSRAKWVRKEETTRVDYCAPARSRQRESAKRQLVIGWNTAQLLRFREYRVLDIHLFSRR